MMEIQIWVFIILCVLSFLGMAVVISIISIFVRSLVALIENYKEYKEFYEKYCVKVRYLILRNKFDETIEEIRKEEQEDND